MDLRSYLKNTPASSVTNLTALVTGFCVGPEPCNLGLPGPALQRKLKDNCLETERGNPPKDLPNPKFSVFCFQCSARNGLLHAEH
jgi:hypothetical protein